MLRDGHVDVETEWAPDGGGAEESHREIDRELRRIAKRRAGLDAEEAKWLREAERLRVWRKLGFSTAIEYLEDVFGFAPRTAVERLRVARELGTLPALDGELRAGRISYSAARELSRVMTPATEQAWLARARGKNLRDIEDLVSGHDKGHSPDDPKDPALVERAVTLRGLSASDLALLRQVRQVLEDECGESLTDSQLVQAIGRCVLAGGTPGAGTPDKPPKPAHRISIRTCDVCKRGTQLGGGREYPISDAALATAECDAELLGHEDAPHARITPTIPPKTRELVWRRDRGRCRVPGCRASRHLAVHHIVFREHGGDHDPANLLVLCSGHHMLLHEGVLTIRGRAPDALTFSRDGTPLVDARAPAEIEAGQEVGATTSRSRFAETALKAQAKQALVRLKCPARVAAKAIDEVLRQTRGELDVATLVKLVLTRLKDRAPDDDEPTDLAHKALVQLGFPPAVADTAVREARAHVGAAVDLSTLIKEALRRCGGG